MALIDLWKSSRTELEKKHVQQIIAIAGEGKLRDGNSTSGEFRALLGAVPASQLKSFAEQCLDDKFDGSGFALQDIVNQIATRLGFKVEWGRYRGQANKYGHDGLWSLESGHKIIVEVKTTDAYSINLETIASYRKKLISGNKADPDRTSLLLVVGRHDTGGLEAQIRGSRYAWDMRVISVEGLLRLMEVKQTMEDPYIGFQVSSILMPQEYTRLDKIIDLVFLTAEDIAGGDEPPSDEDDTTAKVSRGGVGKSDHIPKFHPSSFHEECVVIVEKYIDTSLVKQSRTLYASPDGSTRVWIAVSKQHGHAGKDVFWYAFHPHQQAALEDAESAFVALGGASAKRIFVIPYGEFARHTPKMWSTQAKGRTYLHVKVEGVAGKYKLLLQKGAKNPDITKYLISDQPMHGES